MEVFLEKASSLLDMPDQGFGPGQVDVRLQVPAAAYGPAAGFDQPLDFLEKPAVVLPDPAIQQGLVMVKDQIVVLLQERYGRTERGQGFGTSLLPPPLPDRIQMGVTDQMDAWFFH